MILCLGPTPCFQRTMVFDRLTLDVVNRTQRVREYASGKSTNVARVLTTLGEQVTALTFVGGLRGQAFRADLEASGIASDLIEVQPQTRMAITVVDRAAGTATELLEESHELKTADYEALLARLEERLPSARILVLSGTLTPGAPVDFYARCVKAAESKVRVILDAVGEPLLAALKERPFIVKPNRSELGRTLRMDMASDQAMFEAMRGLIDAGAQNVVVSDGARPTTLFDGKAYHQITSPTIKAVSAIGSGDSFAAGLAAGLSKGQSVPEAAMLGATCGSANAMTPDAGHIDRNDVQNLLPKMELREIHPKR